MTVDPQMLQATLNALESGKPLSQNDRDVLATALQGKQITLSGEERAVAIGGSANNAVIVTGDRNILISKELGEALQAKMQGAGNVEQQFGDRQTTVNNFFILGGEVGNTQRQQGQQVELLLQQLPQEVIRQAYRDALPDGVERSLAPTIDAAKVVAELQDFRRLPDFVQEVVGNQAVPESLREKLLETIGQAPKTSESTAAVKPLLQSHLLIALRLDATSDKLRVNGWLIPDDAERDQAERFQPLDIDASEKGVSCRLEAVPQILEQLVQLSLDYLLGKRYELTIEIFLPLDYLGTAVDDWKIADLYDEVPVGTLHRLVVRSSERLEPKYLASRFNLWSANWERVKLAEQVSQEDFEHLNSFCDCNWKRVANDLMQKLGLKLTCGLANEHQRDVFTTILKAATPIAVWARCDLAHLDQMAEIDALITSNPLLKLSEAVWRQRRQADAEDEPQHHLGAHLGILWEDPDRLTPDAMMQLISPGQ